MLPQWAFEGFRPVCRTICRLLWRIRFLGAENIPRTGGLIIAANHQTYIDPFWVAIPIKRPLRYLAWDEAFSWPVAGRLMVWLGAWPVQLEGCDPAPIRRSLKFLRDGGAVMIFPEGGRGLPDGSMVRFKPGAARMALEADVPILPVTICGGHRVWPKDQIFPHPAPVTITYHPLLRIAPQPGEDARQCARRETARLAEIIRSAL
jgi:1-acyl-sn-glycerol-3-phosphate acyltransferase